MMHHTPLPMTMPTLRTSQEIINLFLVSILEWFKIRTFNLSAQTNHNVQSVTFKPNTHLNYATLCWSPVGHYKPVMPHNILLRPRPDPKTVNFMASTPD